MPKIVDKDAKRLSLIEAAAIVFAREGFARTKMAHIAAQAGVGKGTLYEYFASKNELFLSVCEHCVHWPEDASTFAANPKAGLRDLILALVESYERASGFFSILIDYWSVVIRDPDEHGQMFLARGADFYGPPLALLSEVVSAGQANGRLRGDADPRRTAQIIIAGIEGLRLQRTITPPGFDLANAVAEFADLILRDLTVEEHER